MKKNSNNQGKIKQNNSQVANVPNPPVPNRAHTEMKNTGCNSDKCEIKYENKKN